ncbi:ABC transporter permease [Fulvivirgaceae bacterium BMA12]|uniref:ABC transporter permease n=1 Tax=Agaribacillus aureus TaxID=3051825 RepID=A0ABT8LAS6_9BACT|nr:ABC transporter permease [Fulvivirgaceae bacterium BMA12]
MKIQPPKWACRFLEWYCNPQLLEEIQGDVYELYQRRLANKGRSVADRKFVWEVLRFFRWSNIKRSKTTYHPSNNTAMLKNYLKVSWRSLVKNKGYTALNIAGLAVGICCFILISFYVEDELSYDRFHSQADQTYRVKEIFESDGVGERSASVPFPLAEALMTDYPSIVKNVVRFFNFQAPSVAVVNEENDQEFNESRLFFVDSTFFDIFDFKVLRGDIKTALSEPNSILLTESMAHKYFGDEEPLGKFLKLQGQENLKVTAIVEDTPLNAHFQFDFLVSFTTLKSFYDGQYPQSWYWNPCWTYLVLYKHRSPEDLEARFPEFVQKYFHQLIKDDVTLELQPLTDIHLHSDLDYEIQPNGNYANIRVFISIAIFVLLIACINFITLSTARAGKRAKEVGMRKAIGSHRNQLIKQFLIESLLLTVVAVGFALILLKVSLPFFNQLTEKSIAFNLLWNPLFVAGLVLLTFLIGIISGFYPAFVLSSFKAVKVLKSAQIGSNGVNFRKVLVVLQFSISIILIISAGTALKQLQLLRSNDTGFDQEHVLMIPVSRSPIAQHYEAYKNEVVRDASILSVTAVEEIIGAKHQVGNYQFEGNEESKPFPRLFIRHDFAKTFGVELVAGRDYSEDYPTDDTLALLVNEQLVKQQGWPSNEAAVGKKFRWFGDENGRKIVGVVKDFNFVSKHHPIRPLVLDLDLRDQAFDLFIKYMAVRISGQNVKASVARLEKVWKKNMPERPFDYFFLDENLKSLYKSEEKLSKVSVIFSGFAIFVACLGLFGLATFTAEQRKKEISIRKVLGGTVPHIVWLLTSNFSRLILIAFVISCPLAYWILNSWLSGFAYKIRIQPDVFMIAGAVALVVAVTTISYQAIRAAFTNPANVLKNE